MSNAEESQSKKDVTKAKKTITASHLEVLAQIERDRSAHITAEMINVLSGINAMQAFDNLNSASAASSASIATANAFAASIERREKINELEKTISGFKTQLQEQAARLLKEQATKEELENARKDLEKTIKEIQKKEELAFLLSRVHPVAHDKLLTSPTFVEQVQNPTDSEAFVVSVDIRRSTELMLKARKPEYFARFISKLCEGLELIVKENYGVFDKFTGDGILAFFPNYYSGADSGYRALFTAHQCQKHFADVYKEFRTSFSTVMRDVGLGIGIDYGPVHFLRVAGGLTVVGSPVVYACRLSGAPAGRIYLNQPAFEKIFLRHGNLCYVDETALEIKHEGQILCYDTRLIGVTFKPQAPEWIDGVSNAK